MQTNSNQYQTTAYLKLPSSSEQLTLLAQYGPDGGKDTLPAPLLMFTIRVESGALT